MTPESAGISGNICLLPEGAKAEKIRIKTEKLREAKADARKRVLVARSCARAGRKDVVGEVKGVEMMGVLLRAEGRGREGAEGRRLRLTRSAEALAMMCPTLFLRPLKKAARLEKTKSWLGCAS